VKRWRKWQHEVRRVAEELGVPYLGREMERRGREVSGQAAATGAQLIHLLLEEETTRWPFDEGSLKRRRQCTNSATSAQWMAVHSSVRRDGTTGGRR
jgi:hypothetical protein